MNAEPTSKDRYSKAIKKLYKLLGEHKAKRSHFYTQEDVDDHNSEIRGIKLAIDYLHRCRIETKII